MSCVNENCDKDPLNSFRCVVVSIDGDLACCPECKKAYEQQRDHFYKHITTDEKCKRWLLGKDWEA